MSLWRAKRKYEANQGLNETADDALLAIAILQNESDDFGVYTSHEVRENLEDGCEILQGVRDALENPNEVSRYYLALADHLRTTGRKQTAKQFSRDLETATTALAEASESLQWNSGLNKAKQLLQRVEEFTSETSKRNVDNLRGNLAGGTR
jgi:hypothetical protein